MTDRRAFLISGACLTSAAAAAALIPRKHVALLGRGTLDSIVPRAIPGWASHDVSDLVKPQIEGSLASRLYGETVGRVYQEAATGGEVMMLLAHGDTQSDDLQLHRPEICYPSFGFALSANHVVQVAVAPGVYVPSRRLVAEALDRRETILYWSRLGEYLPLDRRQQHLDRLRTAMKGIVADGLLARFSVANLDSNQALGLMMRFVPVLVRGVTPRNRAGLIGSDRAEAMARIGI